MNQRQIPSSPDPVTLADAIASEGISLMDMIKTSSTYQKLLHNGRVAGYIEETRRMVIRMGTKRLDAAEPRAIAAIENITDYDTLESLSLRLLDPDIRGWDNPLGLD